MSRAWSKIIHAADDPQRDYKCFLTNRSHRGTIAAVGVSPYLSGLARRRRTNGAHVRGRFRGDATQASGERTDGTGTARQHATGKLSPPTQDRVRTLAATRRGQGEDGRRRDRQLPAVAVRARQVLSLLRQAVSPGQHLQRADPELLRRPRSGARRSVRSGAVGDLRRPEGGGQPR